MTVFTQGQRWLVDSEPELGLGMVQSFDARAVLLYFPDSDTERQYALRDAPLTRLFLIQVMNLNTANRASSKSKPYMN